MPPVRRARRPTAPLTRIQLRNLCTSLRETNEKQEETIQSQSTRIKEQDRFISELQQELENMRCAALCGQDEVQALEQEVQDMEDEYEGRIDIVYSDLDDVRDLAVENAEVLWRRDPCLPPQYNSLEESKTPCRYTDSGIFSFQKFEHLTLDYLHPRTKISETPHRLSETNAQIRFLLQRANAGLSDSTNEEQKRDCDDTYLTQRLLDLVYNIIWCLITRHDPLLKTKDLCKRRSKAIFQSNVVALDKILHEVLMHVVPDCKLPSYYCRTLVACRYADAILPELGMVGRAFPLSYSRLLDMSGRKT